MKQRNIVMINDDYSDWKVKGLLAEVVGYDRDKRYLVKLLEKSQTEYLNIGEDVLRTGKIPLKVLIMTK